MKTKEYFYQLLKQKI